MRCFGHLQNADILFIMMGGVGVFAHFTILLSAILALFLENRLLSNSCKITGAALLALAVQMALAVIHNARFLNV